MKRILFTAAEKEELLCAKQVCRVMEERLSKHFEPDFLLTGVGTTSTCYRLVKKIYEAINEKRPYDLMINIGIAGSYNINNSDYALGKTVLIDKEYFGDLGFETLFGFQTLFQSQILDADAFPFKSGALSRYIFDNKTEEMLKTNFSHGIGVTVQTVTGKKEKTEELSKKFNPNIESMEGAAFFYVNILENIPFIELRAVSNAVGENDTSKWESKLALDNLQQSIKILCNHFIDNGL
jgi:Nucleoside phosphorylase